MKEQRIDERNSIVNSGTKSVSFLCQQKSRKIISDLTYLHQYTSIINSEQLESMPDCISMLYNSEENGKEVCQYGEYSSSSHYYVYACTRHSCAEMKPMPFCRIPMTLTKFCCHLLGFVRKPLTHYLLKTLEPRRLRHVGHRGCLRISIESVSKPKLIHFTF